MSGNNIGSTRNAITTPVAGGSHSDGRVSYNMAPGTGYSRIRVADRRPKEEREFSKGVADAHGVEVRFIDTNGTVWEDRELPRCYLPVSGDFNDMTYDPIKGADGKTHHVLLDGMITLFDKAEDTYSPDVGDTPGTCHLPGESLPILPGRRFGEKKLHADITFIAPDTTVKTKARAGDGPGRQGLYSTRITPELDAKKAAAKRELRVSDVRDFDPDEPLLSGTPGRSAAFPFLHERLSLNPDGNVLLHKSTVSGPFNKVLDIQTIRDYLEIGNPGAVVTGAAGDHCSLLPMRGTPSSPVKLWRYSYMVGIALLAEFVERTTTVVREMVINIKRNHSYNKANAAVIKKLWCFIQENPEVQSLLPTLHQQLDAAGPACMDSICQTPCTGQTESEPVPIETEVAGGGIVTVPPGGPPGGFVPPSGTTAGPCAATGGVCSAPAGPGFAAAGGGVWWPHMTAGSAFTAYIWYPSSAGTPYSGSAATGYSWAPGGSTSGPTGPGAGGIPSDIQLKNNVKLVGKTITGFNLYRWDWNDKAIEIGASEFPSMGVLAQEVEQIDPDAVSDWNGFKAVDYRRIW